MASYVEEYHDMVAEQTRPDIAYRGSDDQQQLAQRAFEAVRAHGMFGSDYSPIRTDLSALAEFLSASIDDVRSAVEANDHVFALDIEDEAIFVVTSRLGTPPVKMIPDSKHTFAARFLTPEPAPERPLRTAKPVPDMVVNAEVGDAIEDAEEEAAEVERELRRVDDIDVPTTHEEGNIRVRLVSDEERAEITAAAEKRAEEAAARERAEAAPVEEPEEEIVPVVEEPAEVAPVEEPEEEPAVEEERAAPEPEDQLEPAAVAEVEEVESAPEEAEAVEVPVEAVAEVEVEAAPEPEPEAAPEPLVAMTDLSDYEDDAVAAAIEEALRSDSRIANFGKLWMPEDRVHRLSRGNLRSLADYINEQEQPLTDDMLVQDVLGTRRSSADFPVVRFSMNYRLSSERNFEFVGTKDQPFWGTTDLPPIGTTRRKGSEIGTDYRFLIEEAPPGTIEPRSAKSIEHTLSFYEFTYGLLPLDARMQSLLPGPVMPDQRSAVLTFEIPQFENSVYLVEVRYPTHNRGGFILGLDDFYEEKLVPGAMLSIEATDNDGHYKLEYLEDEEKQDRFLELDDRRAAKYVFRPLSYDTAVADEWLVTESRFPRLGSEKPLSEKKRRRIEEVVEETFTRIGEQDGSAWIASFTDLLVAVNIERPASEAYLRSAIESMASVTDDGSGILTYDASA